VDRRLWGAWYVDVHVKVGWEADEETRARG
jgi:hypothetical protein